MCSKALQGLTLYYSLFSAPCRTVLLTIKHLNIELPPGGMKHINANEKLEYQDPLLEKINYEKVLPTLIDNGFILWESRVIAKYLVQKYAPPAPATDSLYPYDTQQQAYVDRLLYFDHGMLSQSINNYFGPQIKYRTIPNPILGAEVEKSLQLLEKLFSKKNTYVLGGAGGKDHLTIADFSILSTLSQLESMDYSYESHKGIANYVENMKDSLVHYRDCFQEGVHLVNDWARKRLKYLPAYLSRPSVLYEDIYFKERRI